MTTMLRGTLRALHAQAAKGFASRAVLVTAQAVPSDRAQWSLLAAAVGAGVVVATAMATEEDARCDAKAAVLPAVALPGSESSGSSLVGGDESKPARSGKRHLLKSRTRHKAKLEEVDLMKIHLDEYKKVRVAIDSLAKRFELYASKTIAKEGADPVAAMTYTDLVHSLILPRFHTRLPHPDVEYKCDFVGNANGLITFEECYLLIHLLQIPREHFDVAFCMFDLDGDGAVDKEEFCHVIENLLRAITTKEGEQPVRFSAEETLPRLTKYLFGTFGQKIRAAELEAALDVLRKDLLKAEFELYAKPHPSKKSVQVVSVHDFAITLLSCFDADRLPSYLERVEKLNASDEVVTWEDFYKFHFNVESNVADIKLAFELTGAEEITEADFIHAVKVVTGVELPFPVVQLVFRVFDNNENGTLDRSELLKILEMRTNIELQQRRPDSKFKRFLECAKGHKE